MNLIDVLTVNGALPWPIAATTFFLLTLWLWLESRPKPKGKEVYSMPDWPLPYVSNAWRFVFHNWKFTDHLKELLERRDIVSFWMGPQKVYVVGGTKYIQPILRHTGHLSNTKFIANLLPGLDSVTQEDLKVFLDDNSGLGAKPLDDTPEEKRFLAPNHRIMLDHLTSTQATNTLTRKFNEEFMRTISARPMGKWETLRVGEFIKTDLARAAIYSLAGPTMLKLNPDFLEALWDFDDVFFSLMFGVPRLVFPRPYKIRDRFHDMAEKFLNYAFEHYDFESEEEDKDWDELWGLRYVRKHAKFLRDKNFNIRSRAGMCINAVWAQNANTTPIITWTMIEVIRDPKLFAALRAESHTAFDTDPNTGLKTLNPTKLSQLPLLQSVYAESMRLHVSVPITRGVDEEMDFHGHVLTKGSIIQAPSGLAQWDENYWGRENHPAMEFWAERFIVHEEEKDEKGKMRTVSKFSTAAMVGGHWYPYGGGPSMCAGRHFAKQEIMGAVAMIVTNFEIEFLEYVKMDGSPSDRPPKDEESRHGTAAMPPDRDMKIRWRRI